MEIIFESNKEKKQRFYQSYVKKLHKLNAILMEVESSIYKQAIEQDIISMEKISPCKNNIYDYELEVEIQFYSNACEGDPFVYWNENLKNRSINNKYSAINDGQNHNVTSCCWKNKELNKQHHCWLLHRLYDDFNIPWKGILSITNISFDIKICYQYESDIKL